MLKRILALGAVALSLAGCNADDALREVDGAITRTNAAVAKYAPVVGRDLLLVGNILVTAECSPLVGVGTQTTKNVLKITAADSKAAAKVQGALDTNLQVAAELCPLVAQIKTQVGAVPSGMPSQVVAAPAS
jgi:hypothetical protein